MREKWSDGWVTYSVQHELGRFGVVGEIGAFENADCEAKKIVKVLLELLGNQAAGWVG